MTDKQAVTQLIKDPYRIRQSIKRLLADAYQRAKRRTRSKWKPHARPMTWRELRALPYRDYLKTEHWQRVRRKTLKLARYTCQDCGTRQRALQVHHLTYKRLGREKPRDLRVLCGECHKGVHEK